MGSKCGSEDNWGYAECRPKATRTEYSLDFLNWPHTPLLSSYLSEKASKNNAGERQHYDEQVIQDGKLVSPPREIIGLVQIENTKGEQKEGGKLQHSNSDHSSFSFR